MKFKIMESISESYKDYNEDILGHGSNSAWIIDGASALDVSNKIDKNRNDVFWFVNRWNEYLSENLDSDRDIREILKNGIDTISNEVRTKTGNEIHFDLPSAAIAIIRKRGAFLEYYMLGDCTLIIEGDKKISELKDDAISSLDSRVVELIRREGSFNSDFFNGYSKDVLDMLKEHRNKKNRRGGYWILEFDKVAIENGIYGKIEITNESNVLMATDGFSVYKELYTRQSNKNFIEEIKINGLGEIYNRIRKFEFSDEKGLKYPRLRKHDDSSAMLLKLQA